MPHNENIDAASMTNITLYIPGLFGPFPKQWKSELQEQLNNINTMALTRLLSRARFSTATGGEFYLQACQLLLGEGVNIAPIASCRFVSTVTAAENNKWCVNCDPVNIQPDRDQAVLTRINKNLLDVAVSKQVICKINEYYVDEPWELRLTDQGRWVIVSDKHYDIKTTSPEQAQSKNINAHLPSGADARYWHQVLNEIQMLLYQIENFADGDSPQLMFNSVWLWGEGVLPDTKSVRWEKIYTDDDDIIALAMASDIPCRLLEAFAEVNTGGAALVICKQLHDTLLNQDMEKWLQVLAHLDAIIFAPLSDKMGNKTINSFKLVTDTQSCSATYADITRWNITRWLKRAKKLTDFIQWQ